MTAPLYKLNARTFVKANRTQEAWLHESGEVVEYDGIPGPSMDALNPEATAAKAAEAAEAATTPVRRWLPWSG
jgi:hypothetical protein